MQQRIHFHTCDVVTVRDRMQAGETRLRPDAATSGLLIGTLQALQRLATCVQLMEEMAAVRCFASVFSLLDCSCDQVSMEAARLLTRLWAPAAAKIGARPFVSHSAGEEYPEVLPEIAYQVCAASENGWYCMVDAVSILKLGLLKGGGGGRSHCSCHYVSMEAARLLSHLWAPAGMKFGGRPFATLSGEAVPEVLPEWHATCALPSKSSRT
jgi:hypothetical protein